MTQPPLAAAGNPESGDGGSFAPDIVERLCSLPDALGRLAIAYRSRTSEDGSGWVDDYFRASARGYLASPGVPTEQTLGIDPNEIDRLCNGPLPETAQPLKLLSLRSHYFRGFLAADAPVDLSGGLIVVYGRNSHGKTSFAESLEWLLTGTLSRRSKGDARELEGCISSIFRPATESTWVEATFQAEGEPAFTLRRELLEDFGSTTTSRCRSRLYIDGDALDDDSERTRMQRLFAGVAPLLMQHTLRDFVQSNPAARRQYFEQLLKLDDLTTMIERAVIGDARLREFSSEDGGTGLRHWEAVLEALIPSTARQFARALDRINQNHLREAVVAALQNLAANAFHGLTAADSPLDDSIRSLSEEQQKSRHQSFEPLADLRPSRTIDDNITKDLAFADVRQLASSYLAAFESLEVARRAASIVGDAQNAIARAVDILKAAGLIDEAADIQMCPVCESAPASLPRSRVDTIASWEPLVSAVRRAENATQTAAEALRTRLQSVWKICSALLPSLPRAAAWDAALGTAATPVKAEAEKTRASLAAAREAAQSFASALVEVGRALGSTPFEAADILRSRLPSLEEGMEKFPALARGYFSSFTALDSAVGTQAKEDPDYAKRALWIQAASSVDQIAGDLAWERAKLAAQKELSIVRDALISARTRLLESRRSAFSDGMTEVWRTLRSDAHSHFESLTVPPPRGRGFPVSIEVKALLQGPGGTKSVDALRVFSESQVHVLGIAAFVTRSKLLGHRILIFDDPVQSMDEDHFRTFAGPFLRQLLQDGFQILLLTHNQAFERNVSFEHFDSEQYVTLSVTRTARRGCILAEGNRRVSERLRVAEKRVDEGDLVTAWVWIRQALERLYTVVRIKYGPPGFDPSTWARNSAENMWNEGTGDLVSSRDPNAGQRLKQILDMTAGGAHDASRDGETDARNAIAYIRSLLTTLRVGG